MAKAVITGGSGFVGSHLVDHLIKNKAYDSIIIADIVSPEADYSGSPVEVEYINWDIRKPADVEQFRQKGCKDDTVIYNLAAICRIPGFPVIDYFKTNISGAETVCRLAGDLGVQTIVFTSSVAPYGASEELKTEETVPQPDNPYGSSKLVAEYIHRGWQQKDPENRSLSILRPGIIFGKGEQANFTRLYRSQKMGFFIYPGRKDTRKACIYVKDVARACYHFSNRKAGIHLFNLVYEVPPTIEEICTEVARHTDAKIPWIRIPGPLLIFVAYGIMGMGKIIGKTFTGIHPDRVKKVMISTNISGRKLFECGFDIKYNLANAVSDWYRDCNEQGLY